jgi:hypothetical protein
MPDNIGRLIEADEFLNHQTTNSFSTVATADYSWTEKIWATLIRKDGGLQVNFGLGKYTNRGVVDGFAGIARGLEQRTVRASGALRHDRNPIELGPLRYEVLTPLDRMRLSLAENAAQPLQFDLQWEGYLPPFFEGRDWKLEARTGRALTDVIRYHQSGTVSGWVLIDGERIEVKPDEWFGVRDHSWGIREHVGHDPSDLAPNEHDVLARSLHVNWLVSHLRRPDGSVYELAYYFRENGHGLQHFTGYINEADGTQLTILKAWPEFEYRRRDLALLRGKVHVFVDRRDGPGLEQRTFEIETLNPQIGFRLNPALYMPWKGAIHGSWKGENHIEGECIADTDAEFTLAQNMAWQVRDRPFRICEGDAMGYGDVETVVIGDWPGANLVDG